MSDWFDHTNEPVESKEPVSPAPEEITPDTTTAETATTESEAPAPETPTQSPVTPVDPVGASWTAPSDNGCTYHYANPYRQQEPPTPPANGSAWQPNPNPAPNPYGSWNVQPPPPQKPRKKVRGTSVLLAVLSVVCVLALIACGVLTVQLLSDDQAGAASSLPGESTVSQGDTSEDVNESAPSLTIDDREESLDGGLSIKEIINRNLDCTVLIDIYTYTTNMQGGFNHWGGYGEGNGKQLEQSGCATGIVWTADGYIITNAHCVMDEETGEAYPRVDVTLYNGTVYENVEIVGFDQTSDLAVIKVNATDLTPAQFGDSTKLEMGDRVVAIGNPGGLGFTSSYGTISGLERDVYDDAGYGIKCLQTDAVINPGNSGGPLINAYGQVIGINSAKIVSEGYEGLGFSIPINEAKPILDDLVKYHYVTGRVSLGITGYSVTTVGLEGFQIASIEKGSALEGTNAKVGDIISYVDDTRVTGYSELRAALASHKVGDTVKLTLMRYDSRTHDIQDIVVTCTLGENRG